MDIGQVTYMSGYVYILITSNDTFSIGSTNNLLRRLREHQAGQEAYTKNKLPVTLVFSQKFDTFQIARKYEIWLKKQKSRLLIKTLVLDGKIRKQL